jgi:uncharacterized SAM-binding protein YcdF (DUF218 family)
MGRNITNRRSSHDITKPKRDDLTLPAAGGKLRRWRRVVITSFALLMLLAGVLWWFPQQVLTVDSGPVQAEALVVLGGGVTERPRRAAELFQAGEAPLVICSGLGDCNSNRRLLAQNGVPATAIQVECNSRNTSENARFTIALLRKQGVKSAILVTSWYHSRRALNCFEHYAPEIKFYSRPSHFAADRADWKPKGIEGYIRWEYAKNLGYLVRYGVWPL